MTEYNHIQTYWHLYNEEGIVLINQNVVTPIANPTKQNFKNTMQVNKGTNQVDVRHYNERLIMQLVRQHGSLTKVDATKATGLSANAISVIFRSLEKENLLIRGEPIRGKVGQPSVPMSINPKAGYYLGLKIGRRNSDLILVDFVGHTLVQKSITYDYPLPEVCIDFASEAIIDSLKKAGISKDKILGVGIAIPYQLWNWTSEFGAPTKKMQAWREPNLQKSLSNNGKWPVIIENDGNAACAAELAFGTYPHQQDFIYFFVGTMIGGGIVINGSVYKGPNGNASSFGSMPIPDREGKASRLVDQASLFTLDQMIIDRGGKPKAINRDEQSWIEHEAIVNEWVSNVARGLSYAVISSLSLIDFPLIVVDGAFPPFIRKQLVEELTKQIDTLNQQGVNKPLIAEGNCGYIARALGAAGLVLSESFAIDQNTLFRENQ